MASHNAQEPRHPIEEPDSGYWRLEDQIGWYNKKSGVAQKKYKGLKAIEIFLAALIPVLALIDSNNALWPGIFGAGILIVAGFLELGTYHRNWTKYRTTCEALKHEKFLYLGNAGPYRGLDETRALEKLVVRVEAMISEENTNWSRHIEDQTKKDDDPDAPAG